MNFGDAITLLALGIAVFFAARHALKSRGKCSGGCAGCAMRGSCHKRKSDESEQKEGQ